MKYLITESQLEYAIDKFITLQLEPHEKKISSKYPYSVFWVKKGKIVGEFISRNQGSFVYDFNNFYIHSDIWGSIEDMFSLKYNQVEKFLNDWFDKHFDPKKRTVCAEDFYRTIGWQEIESLENQNL